MKIKDLLYRLDEEAIQLLIGKEVLFTLTLLGGEYAYFKNLLNAVSLTYSNADLLINKLSRDLLIDMMKLEEVDNLAKHLNINPKQNPYKEIKDKKFGNTELKELFNFFEEEYLNEKANVVKTVNKIEAGYPLYPYQREVLKEVEFFLNTNKNRVLLHMPTGSGKTRTTISYICKYLLSEEKKNVIWFANTIELLNQAFDEFVKAWSYLGNREIETYKLWGSSNIDISTIKGSLIICGTDKAYQILMRDIGKMSAFAYSCSLVIMDEAHMAIAPTYELLLENMIQNGAGLIGLSATPGRTWNDPNEDIKLANFFYGQKAMLKIKGYDNPVDYLINEGYLAKSKNTRLLNKVGIEFTDEDHKYLSERYVLSPKILEKISKNTARNILIVSKVRELIKIHKRIILFAITKDHAIILNSLLIALGIDSMVVTSETSTLNRTSIIERFKISRLVNPNTLVLCNYGILTTGFDAPETSCAIISRPTDSLVLYSQMVGRAIRGIKSGGNEEAEIVTVIDENLPGFNAVAEAFINWEDVWNQNLNS